MNVLQILADDYPHTQAFDHVELWLRNAFKSRAGTVILGGHLLRECNMPSDYIIYNLEQITSESPLVSSEYIELMKRQVVWDYSKRNIAELEKLGIKAIHMPIGYDPSLAKIPANIEKDIDCLFYGSINERRRKILSSVNAHTLFGVYGEELDAYIARARIVLNCHFYESKLFEVVRCSYLLANNKFVISEPGLDKELEEPFKDGIAFHEKEEWKDAVKFYLAHPEVMDRIAAKGFEIFSNMRVIQQ